MPMYNNGAAGLANMQQYGGNGGAGVAGTAAADTGLTVNQKRLYTGIMIKRMLAELLFLANEGKKTTIPENSGGFTANSIRFMVQGSALSLATTALTEGVAPTPQSLDWREIGTRLAQYGGVATHTDLLKHAGISGVISQISDALGEQAGRTLNQLMMNVCLGGSNVLYGGGAANRGAMTVAATYKMTAALIKRAARDLRRRGVPKFSDGYYHAILADDQLYDLQDDPAWQALNGYQFSVSTGGGNKTDQLAADGGILFGVKITGTPGNTIFAATTGANLPNTGDVAAAAGMNVAQGIVYGPDAFGFFDHAAWKIPNLDRKTGQGVRIYMVPADQETKDDPLGQVGVMGWKLAFGGCILDQRRMVRLETTTTLNDTAYDYGSNAGVTGGSSNPALL